MRVVRTHTGKIYVDGDKKLGFLTVGDYGRENNIKASFLGLDKEIDGVRRHAVDLTGKWVVTISTQRGCPIGCQFRDCPKYGLHGSISHEELVYEIETILANEQVTHTNRFDVHFTHMGEPTFNDAVLLFAELNLKSLVNRFTTADTIHSVVSTVLPEVDANLKSSIMEWCRIRNSVYSEGVGLQFSINSADQAQHNEQLNEKSLSLSETSSLAPKLPTPVGRKYMLNFAVAADMILDAVEFGKLFNKEKSTVKITPIHQTNATIKNRFDVTTEYADYDVYRKFEDPLVAAGWDVIVFVPGEKEDSDHITYGDTLIPGK